MKKLLVIILVVLFISGLIPQKNVYLDGGTIEYRAFFYRIIFWHKINTHSFEPRYIEGVDFYIFPFNFGSIDDLGG